MTREEKIAALRAKEKYELSDLLTVVELLRSPGCCPWDMEQTHKSIRNDFIEETYEVIEAIDTEDPVLLREELGDVLLQVVFHARMAEEAGRFTFEDVVDGVAQKLVFRHPHVFGNGEVKADTPEQVLVNWEALKKVEKDTKTQTAVMQSVPEALPALIRARKVQKKAADVGFDFPVTEKKKKKVYEELQELEEAAKTAENADIEEEFGDLLFALVNISRFLKINPEFALTKAIKKFINRFEYIEKSALFQGKNLSDMTLEEMDLLWDEAKIALRPKK